VRRQHGRPREAPRRTALYVNRIDATELILKRASTSRPSGEWNDDDYDVLVDGAVVGRIMKAAASPRRNAVDVHAGLWAS
jgi:hypothetical protein